MSGLLCSDSFLYEAWDDRCFALTGTGVEESWKEAFSFASKARGI